MAVRAIIVALALALFGCHENVALTLPSADGAASLFLAGYDGPATQASFLVAMSPEHPIDTQYVARAGSTLELAGLACTLEQMTIPEGSLALNEAATTELLFTGKMRQWRLEQGEAGWTSLDPREPAAIDETLQHARLDQICYRRGLSYDFKQVYTDPRIGSGRDFDFDAPLSAVEYPAGHVLITTYLGRMFSLTAKDAETTTLALSRRAVALAPAGPGAIWTIDADGQLAHVDRDGLVEPFPGRAPVATASISRFHVGPLGFLVLDANGRDDTSDLFAVSDDRILLKHDGTEWRTISSGVPGEGWKLTLSDMLFTAPYVPKLVRMGPQRVAANGVTPLDNEVVIYAAGNLRTAPVTGAHHVTSLYLHPALGLLAADDLGRVHQLTDGGFVELHHPHSNPILTLDSEGESLIIGELYGALSFNPWTGWCPQPSVQGLVVLLHMGDERAFIGAFNEDFAPGYAGLSLGWSHTTRRATACTGP